MSGFAAVVHCEPLGLLGDAQVLLPDSQVTGLRVGAVVKVEGTIRARLAGGDFAAIRTTVIGERISPLGEWVEWIAAHTRKAEGRAA